MPVYTYHCENCEHEFEKLQSFSEGPLTSCPKCKRKTLQKVYKPALVMFKGSGYYVTDHRSSNNATVTNNKKKASSENGGSEKKSEEKPIKKETKEKSNS